MSKRGWPEGEIVMAALEGGFQESVISEWRVRTAFGKLEIVIFLMGASPLIGALLLRRLTADIWPSTYKEEVTDDE